MKKGKRKTKEKVEEDLKTKSTPNESLIEDFFCIKDKGYTIEEIQSEVFAISRIEKFITLQNIQCSLIQFELQLHDGFLLVQTCYHNHQKAPLGTIFLDVWEIWNSYKRFIESEYIGMDKLVIAMYRGAGISFFDNSLEALEDSHELYNHDSDVEMSLAANVIMNDETEHNENIILQDNSTGNNNAKDSNTLQQKQNQKYKYIDSNSDTDTDVED